MARQPQYPDADASVGSSRPATESETPEASKQDGPAGLSAKPAGAKRNKQLATGAAIGIGSAAIVAALLYANRRSKSGRDDT